eukprot:jgi/Chrzof1/4875/Cz15g02150.t1
MGHKVCQQILLVATVLLCSSVLGQAQFNPITLPPGFGSFFGPSQRPGTPPLFGSFFNPPGPASASPFPTGSSTGTRSNDGRPVVAEDPSLPSGCYWYTLQQGESLSRVAATFDIPLEVLLSFNTDTSSSSSFGLLDAWLEGRPWQPTQRRVRVCNIDTSRVRVTPARGRSPSPSPPATSRPRSPPPKSSTPPQAPAPEVTAVSEPSPSPPSNEPSPSPQPYEPVPSPSPSSYEPSPSLSPPPYQSSPSPPAYEPSPSPPAYEPSPSPPAYEPSSLPSPSPSQQPTDAPMETPEPSVMPSQQPSTPPAASAKPSSPRPTIKPSSKPASPKPSPPPATVKPSPPPATVRPMPPPATAKPSPPPAAGATAQQQALLKLKAAVDPQSKSKWLNSWKQGSDYCTSWSGVFCDEGTKDVTSIIGGAVGLDGTLPPADVLKPLQKLQEIILPANKLKGTLPASWGQLTGLTQLWLSNNTLAGSLPQEWSKLTNLKQMWLATNGLTGQVPKSWGSLTQLRQWSIYNNPQLGGCLPAAWKGKVKYYPGNKDSPTEDIKLALAGTKIKGYC